MGFTGKREGVKKTDDPIVPTNPRSQPESGREDPDRSSDVPCHRNSPARQITLRSVCARRSDYTDAPSGLPVALWLLNNCHPRPVKAYHSRWTGAGGEPLIVRNVFVINNRKIFTSFAS
jgi:hypothetical protein